VQKRAKQLQDKKDRYSETNGRRSPATVRLPLWALGILGAFIAVAVLASAVWLFNTIRDAAAASAGDVPEFTLSPDDVEDTAVLPISGEAAPGATREPLPVLAPEDIQPWSGDERINLLFMGVDQRCGEEGPAHTDTMMLATVDPLSKSAALFSLPRDLWVEIPGFGVDRINQAFYFGQAYEYPGGGPALAQETVEALLGVPVDYYLTVDFQAFVDAVNLIGGLTIDVPEAINDPDYPDSCYGYDPFSIQVGKQRLDGEAALKYARTRATAGGDVDRAGRQQAVLLAIREQVAQLDQLPGLIVQAPLLWRSLQDNVNTNLPLQDLLELAMLVQGLPSENIRTAVLDYDYVYIETTPDGRQVLVPRREEIRRLRNEVFAVPAIPTPIIANLQKLMSDEGARVAIYNGTAVFGLAGDTQSVLEDLGITVAEIGNADSSAYSTSQVIDYGSHPQTVRYLIQEMGILPLNSREAESSDPQGAWDVLVIIGEDWAGRIGGES
jgi:LCP family protein required for cell wall assembly